MKMLNFKRFIKKYWIIAIIIFILLFAIFKITKTILYKNVAENAINKYLQEKNVKKEEIKELRIFFDTKVGNRYTIEIVYNDEPNLIYEYYYVISKNTLNYFAIYEMNGGICESINIRKKIIPLHEDIEIVYSSSYDLTILLKYTFFDYVKDLLVK